MNNNETPSEDDLRGVLFFGTDSFEHELQVLRRIYVSVMSLPDANRLQVLGYIEKRLNFDRLLEIRSKTQAQFKAQDEKEAAARMEKEQKA